MTSITPSRHSKGLRCNQRSTLTSPINLATFEADNTDKKQPIVLSDGQRSSIKQFIRYILAGAEATGRVVAAVAPRISVQPATANDANYFWHRSGFLHSLISLARLTNYYLETENDDRKAVLLVLIIINAVGSGVYFVGSQKALAAIPHPAMSSIAQTTTASTAASTTPPVTTVPTATGATASTAATSATSTKRTPAADKHNQATSTPQATQPPMPVIVAPATMAMTTDARNRELMALTASINGSTMAPSVPA